jgi:hypothetical protein
METMIIKMERSLDFIQRITKLIAMGLDYIRRAHRKTKITSIMEQ